MLDNIVVNLYIELHRAVDMRKCCKQLLSQQLMDDSTGQQRLLEC